MKFFDGWIEKQYKKRFPEQPPQIEPAIIQYDKAEALNIMSVLIIPREIYLEETNKTQTSAEEFEAFLKKELVRRMEEKLQEHLKVYLTEAPELCAYRITGKIKIVDEGR